MTFEEWWAKQTANFDPEEIGLMQLARVTWNAAQDVEREECARVADAAASMLGDMGRKHMGDGNQDSMNGCYVRSLQCTQLAADIRTRPNATGNGPSRASGEGPC